ncbi:Hypothetical predicted protein [Cloeon dipterum]|uniref:Uncharacterized protein n=1 Tax=Cloeon dipterum TaxID=197152 RepID=A0A8S1DPV7_9INSE|nr:Hypothetical predicted protein [Cloeon dipterum]
MGGPLPPGLPPPLDTFKNVALIAGLDVSLFHLGLEFMLALALGQLFVELSIFVHNHFIEDCLQHESLL